MVVVLEILVHLGIILQISAEYWPLHENDLITSSHQIKNRKNFLKQPLYPHTYATSSLGNARRQSMEEVIVHKVESLDKPHVKPTLKSFQLHAHKNMYLTSPDFTAVTLTKTGARTKMREPMEPCHYLHRDMDTVAAFSDCLNTEKRGLMISRDGSFSLHHMHSINNSRFMAERIEKNQNYGHVSMEGDTMHIPHFLYQYYNKKGKKPSSDVWTVELGVFMDFSCYKIHRPQLNSDSQLRDMILGYINQIQAIFNHPTLKKRIILTVKYLELMTSHPQDPRLRDGERGQLLSGFCDYSDKLLNKPEFKEIHWDLSILITGLDLYVKKKGKKNRRTFGLAHVNGVCIRKFNCVISELGVRRRNGGRYPTTHPETSAYILAHEIGHSLGMSHDGLRNSCPKDGYIMSDDLGFSKETTWSPCSAKRLKELRLNCLENRPQKSFHNTFKNQATPGQQWRSDYQCQTFLKDQMAKKSGAQLPKAICEDLKCDGTNTDAPKSAGPALDGTRCGTKKWCMEGSCVQKPGVDAKKSGGNSWTKEPCKTPCIKKAIGVQVARRRCNNPFSKYTNVKSKCAGVNIKIRWCKQDQKTCVKPVRPNAFAKTRCQEVAEELPTIQGKEGIQAKHSEKTPWQACAVYCRMAKTGDWYAPRNDLSYLNIDGFFPDGTWCHYDGHNDYYCMQHECVPK